MNTIPDSTVLNDLGLSRSLQTNTRTTELGQKDFLRLMTTQLKNQDPMKPMENGDFIGQMAQFGTVTGIEDLRTELQNLTGSLVSNQTLQAAGMVGRDVLVPASSASIATGGTVSGMVELDQSVSSMNVGVYDLSGQLVRKISLGMQSPGMVAFNWDGLATDGSAVPPGRYELRAEAVSGGVNTAYNVLLSDRVESVSLPGGGKPFTLTLAGLGDVNFDAVRQIR